MTETHICHDCANHDHETGECSIWLDKRESSADACLDGFKAEPIPNTEHDTSPDSYLGKSQHAHMTNLNAKLTGRLDVGLSIVSDAVDQFTDACKLQGFEYDTTKLEKATALIAEWIDEVE